MRRSSPLWAVTILCAGFGCSVGDSAVREPDLNDERKMLVAHRGASGYAPEHTRAAYHLALEQGADFLEPDLHLTRDGVLIAFHDLTLDRTTNVRDVFPDRYREVTMGGNTVQQWHVSDFTLEEIRQLDAGSWFSEEFRGAGILTFAEVIEIALGRAGLFPETKSPELYRERGFDMERGLLTELERYGLHEPGAVPETPVIIQSFSAESLGILRHELGSELPLTFLLSGGGAQEWLTPEGLERVREFASGIGPAKNLLSANPSAVAAAHAAGLTVVPWTFRASGSGDFPDVTSEMAHFLYELGVDGLFTDNPDLFPRAPLPPGGA